MQRGVAAGHGVLAQDRDVGAGVEVDAGRGGHHAGLELGRLAVGRGVGEQVQAGRRPGPAPRPRSRAGEVVRRRARPGVARTAGAPSSSRSSASGRGGAGGQGARRARRRAPATRSQPKCRAAERPSGAAARALLGAGLARPRAGARPGARRRARASTARRRSRSGRRGRRAAPARRARMRQPACGGQNSSVGPPAVRMTGRPLAIASSTGMAKPSPR